MKHTGQYAGGILFGIMIFTGIVLIHQNAGADQTSDAAAAYATAVQQMKAANNQLAAAREAAATAKVAADAQAQAAAAAAAAPATTPPPQAVVTALPGHSVLDFSPILQALMQYLMLLMAAVFPAMTAWLVYEFRRRTNVVVAQTATAQAAQARATVVQTTAGLIKGDIAAGRLTMADVLAADPESDRLHPVLRSRLSKAVYSLRRPEMDEEPSVPMVQRLETDADHMAREVLGALGHSPSPTLAFGPPPFNATPAT